MPVAFLIAILIGAAIALQAAIVSDATATVHPLTVSLALLVSGLAVGSVWATVNSQWTQALHVASNWWWLPLGIAGWAIVAALGWTAARLGIAAALALIVGAQLSVGLALDVIRGTAIGWRSIIGMAFVVAGVAMLNSPNNG